MDIGESTRKLCPAEDHVNTPSDDTTSPQSAIHETSLGFSETSTYAHMTKHFGFPDERAGSFGHFHATARNRRKAQNRAA